MPVTRPVLPDVRLLGSALVVLAVSHGQATAAWSSAASPALSLAWAAATVAGALVGLAGLPVLATIGAEQGWARWPAWARWASFVVVFGLAGALGGTLRAALGDTIVASPAWTSARALHVVLFAVGVVATAIFFEHETARVATIFGLDADLRAGVARLLDSRSRLVAVRARNLTAVDAILLGRVVGELEGLRKDLASVDWAGIAPEEAVAGLEGVRKRLDDLREGEIREISHLLHPSIIDMGLAPAIRSVARSKRGDVAPALEIDPRLASVDMPGRGGIRPDVRLAAYRAVEEALDNAMAHASASRVAIAVRLIGHDSLEVLIDDDGRGFAPDGPRSALGGGLDLVAIRIASTGGRLAIDSSPLGGTRVRATFDLARAAGAMAT